jgi:hypothetical protein
MMRTKYCIGKYMEIERGAMSSLIENVQVFRELLIEEIRGAPL